MTCDLDKKDTAILKGIAISFIVFHNYFHVLGAVRENEFNFDPARFPLFLHTVVHPSQTIQALFSFYGHFGVQVFIFLSAYGIAKSHWDDVGSWPSFMWSRVKKLYPMFMLAVLFWAVLAAMHVGPLWVIRDAGPELLLMLAGASNLVPGLGLPPVGPWWFIPFIMQFYAIWPMLKKITNKVGWPGLVVLCVVCFVISEALNPVLAQWSITMAENPIGRMRVFCLGIIAARYPMRIHGYLAALAFAIILLGSEYHAVSYVISLAAVLLSLWLYMKMRSLLRRSRTLELIGNYSLAIFLVNGIVRVPFVYLAKSPVSELALGATSAVVTFAISAFFHYLLEPTPHSAKGFFQFNPWRNPKPVEATD